MEEKKEPFEKFYELFSQSPISIELSDSKGILQNINQHCIDLYGIVDTSDVINKYNLFEDPNIIDSVKERIKNKELVEYEIIYDFNLIKAHNLYRTTKSGVIKLSASIAPFILGGKINGYIIATIDITKQKEAEQILKESEEKFRTISEQSLMGIAIAQDNKIQYINKAYANIFGYTVDEMMIWELKDVFNAIHPDDREFTLEQLAKKQRGDDDIVKHYKYRGVKKSGKIIWVNQYSQPITYKGKTANFITLIDITKRKKATDKLEEARKQADIYLNLAGVILVALNKEGIITLMNKKGYEILEYEDGELEGQNWFFTCLPPFMKNEVFDDFRKLIRGEIEGLEFYENSILTKNGKEKTIAWHNTILYDNDENIIGTLSSGEDITERRKAEQELSKLSKLKSELLTRTSHELKTPAMHIKGYADLLLNAYKKNLGIEELQIIGHIKKGVLRLETLIHDILHKAELDSGHGELNKAQNDLSSIIELSVKELNSFAALREHSIILDVHANMIINFDKEQIRHVINNLITNAIKYTPLNGIIGVNSIITDDFITIAIQDNGIGLTEEQTKMLFTQFGKIERYGQGFDIITEGSGLGLHIAKKIIDLHGGKIWAESGGINRGSTFYFSLPITKS